MTTKNGVKPNTLDLPYSEQAEQQLLGIVQINPDAFDEVSQYLRPDDLFLQRHQWVWQACVTLNKRGDPIDMSTVMMELTTMGKLDMIGGVAYLMHLANSVTSTLHADFYGRVIQKIANRRRLMAMADEIKALALDESLDIETVNERVIEKAMKAVDGDDEEITGFTTLSAALAEHWEMVEQATSNPDYFPGVPSCIPALTEALEGGYANNELTLGAGRPGMGKSSWLVSEAIHAAKLCTGNEVVLLFTLEMPRSQIAGMAAAARIHVPPKVQIRGRMKPGEMHAYVQTQSEITRTYGDFLLIDDNAELTPAKLKAKCKRVSKRRKIKAVFVDYAQLMSGGKEDDYFNRTEEMAYVSRSLKKLAKIYHAPVVAATQLGRKVDERQDKRPVMSDIRESGAFENDADVVLTLYRDDYYKPVEPQPEISQVEVAIAKGRELQARTVIAGFRGATKEFVPIRVEQHSLKDMPEDVPF